MYFDLVFNGESWKHFLRNPGSETGILLQNQSLKLINEHQEQKQKFAEKNFLKEKFSKEQFAEKSFRNFTKPRESSWLCKKKCSRRL